MKSAQASEIKPTLQHVYIDEFNRKLKSMGKNAAINSKQKSKKSWWIYPYSVEKKYMTHLKMPQQENVLNKQITLPIFASLINNQNKNIDLSPDMEIIKITTVVEAIRQKQRNNAQVLKAEKNIQEKIGNKRSKRSSYESRNNSQNTQQGKTFVSNKKSHYSKPDYRKQQKRTLPTRKQLQNENVIGLKAANNVAIPSNVFYKRIWEYINGTRPHTDIMSDYNSLENNLDNSTCTNEDRITTSQSQENKSQITSPNIKPKRDFYKHIWDIINAIQLNAKTNVKTRSKRNASIPKRNAVSTPCTQEGTVNYEEDKQVQATNENISLGITDINLPKISDSGPYISGVWTANKIQWQPKKIPIMNVTKLNNDLNLSLLASEEHSTYSASEVDDLNKLPDKIKNIDYSSLDNSTEYANEMSNSSQEIISKSESPYSSEESFITSSFSSTESTVEKPLQGKNQVESLTDTTPNYHPSNIPYVEVPDYSDQQNSLDKSNQNTTATRYKEYDDSNYDYIPKLHNVDDFSSKSPNAEIKIVQTKSNEPEILNANNSCSSCTESKDVERDNYNVEDTKLPIDTNKTEDVTDDVHYSAKNSAESALSEKNENSDFVNFDEYKKPFNWDEFFNDPILESIKATFNKKYDYKEYPDRTKKSEEIETYATDDSKEQLHDYFHDDYDKNKAKEETDSHKKKEAKESEAIDKDYYPYDDKDFFKHIFGKDSEKESDYNYKQNSDYKKPKEIETYTTDPKEYKEKSDHTEESEEAKTYATDPKAQLEDYFANEDYHDNHRIASDETDEANDREESDFYAKKKEQQREEIDEDYYNKNFFKRIFGKDNDKKSSDAVDTENEFLSRYFTKDVLRKLQDNSTAKEDRQREESKNREDIHKTLSRILDKKDHFSRLDENLNKMIEKGEAIPIKYNNFWSLEYESPRKKNEQETKDSKEEV